MHSTQQKDQSEKATNYMCNSNYITLWERRTYRDSRTNSGYQGQRGGGMNNQVSNSGLLGQWNYALHGSVRIDIFVKAHWTTWHKEQAGMKTMDFSQ